PSAPSCATGAPGRPRRSCAAGRARASCHAWPGAPSRSAGRSCASVASRAEFLGRVRGEVARARAAAPASPAARPARPAEAAELVRGQMLERWPEALARFQAEFERVGGVLHRVATRAEVPGVVAAIARERGAGELVTWTPAAMGVDLAGPLGAA